MICNEFRDRVDELLDGLLPPEESRRLEVHSVECDACRAELEAAAKFFNFLDESGRDALEIFDAANLTQDVARRVARESVRPDRTPPGPRPSLADRLRWPLRLAAAAALAAIALTLPGLFVPEGDDVVLAVGERVTLPSEQEAIVREGCRLRVLDATHLTLAPEQGREILVLHEGHALFLLTSDEPLFVSTVRGTVVATGSTYAVAILPGGEVVIDVLSGRVHFEGERGRRVVRSGERLVLESDDSMHVVSRAALEERDLMLALRDTTIVALRGDLERRDEELAVHRSARSHDDPEPTTPAVSGADLDSLPWKELASATRVLIPRSKGRYYDDPARMRAVAVFLQNAEKIQALTGERDPISGLWHPAFIERMAEPFFDVLVPYAPVQDRRAAAARVQIAADIAHKRLASDLVPSEVIQVRLELFRDIILAARGQLGDQAAAEIAEGMHIMNRLSRVRWQQLDETTSRDVVSYWGKHFDLVDSQRDGLRPYADTYVNATVIAQAEVTARLGHDEAERVLFPDWLAGSRLQERERPSAASANRQAETVLATIQAKLQLIGPRIAFEKDLRLILRADQIARGFGRRWGILTFKPDEL